MSTTTTAPSITTGQDFIAYIERPTGGPLVDFTGWGARFVGRMRPSSSTTIFEYTEADNVSLGTFDVAGTDHNISLKIPFEKTAEMRAQGISKIHIGLYLTPPVSQPLSTPQQVLEDYEISITPTVAI